MPALEGKISAAVTDAFERYGLRTLTKRKKQEKFDINENVQYLFSARYSLEKEIRRIWRERLDFEENRRSQPIFRLVEGLVQTQLIEPQLGHLMREVYSVCSPAVHGEEVSIAQVKFVRDVMPNMLTILRAL